MSLPSESIYYIMASQRSTCSLIQSLQRRFATTGSIQGLYRGSNGWAATSSANTTTVQPPAAMKTSGTSSITNCQRILRRSMAYASVNHEAEYKNEMEGRHGEQLQLAYEEGFKYEQKAIDPFELYKIEEEDDELLDEEVGDEYDDDDVSVEDDGDDDQMELSDGDGEDGAYLQYGRDGHLKRSKAEIASFKAGAPAGGKFAIINLNGSQQKVTIDDVVIVNKLKPVHKWAVGSTHTLNAYDDQVLLLGSQEKTLVGLPFVNGGEVDVMVEEITRDKKVIVFKKKRRKNYRRKNGFKREVTFLRVLDIRFP